MGIQRQSTGLGPGAIEKCLIAYEDGDINRLDDLDEWRKGERGWTRHRYKMGKYLEHVKSLSQHWPHLQLLADFMDVGTTPVRWNPKVAGGLPEDPQARDNERRRRMEKTRVSMLDYPLDGGVVKRHDMITPDELKNHLTDLKTQDSSSVKFRLFVVEDLSREVIEALGSFYDVDPDFFREHAFDNVWYNIKDWWRDPPNLDIVSRGQNWFQMRFPRARFFKNDKRLEEGRKECNTFNVTRELRADFNHSKMWDTDKDKDEARIGTVRTRVTFWVKQGSDIKQQQQQQQQQQHQHQPSAAAADTPANERGRVLPSLPRHTSANKATGFHEPVVGILLLDPTNKLGHPLWQHYRNWNKPPSMHEPRPPLTALPMGPPQASLFEDFLYWAQKPSAFAFNGCCATEHGQDANLREQTSPICHPVQALLHIVCTEWLTLIEYIKTRLNQIDWEITFPDNFLTKDEQIGKALTKLHYWRRVVPLYRSMLAETFLRVFREVQHPDRMHPGRGDVAPFMTERERAMMRMQDRASLQHHAHMGKEVHVHVHRGPSSVLGEMMNRDCISIYKQDYALVLNQLEEYQTRIDRLTEVVTAVISIQDSRRGYKDNKNLQWLTWLATFFIPLSFVATMLSMTTDSLDSLGPATILWAQVSVPSGLVMFAIVGLMSIAKCRRLIRQVATGFPWFGEWRPYKKTRKES